MNAFNLCHNRVMTSVASLTHQALLDRFQSADWLSPLLTRLERREAHLENLTTASLKALVIAAVFQRLRQPLLLITPDPNTGLKLYGELLQYGLPVARTPAEDFSPYDLDVYPARALCANITPYCAACKPRNR